MLSGEPELSSGRGLWLGVECTQACKLAGRPRCTADMRRRPARGGLRHARRLRYALLTAELEEGIKMSHVKLRYNVVFSSRLAQGVRACMRTTSMRTSVRTCAPQAHGAGAAALLACCAGSCVRKVPRSKSSLYLRWARPVAASVETPSSLRAKQNETIRA